MDPDSAISAAPAVVRMESIGYVRQMLGELRGIANREGADVLAYLIEMAYFEAGDIQTGIRPLSRRGERDLPAGMAVKPPGKVKF